MVSFKVESLQDIVEQNTKRETGVGRPCTSSFGTAWQASGNLSSGKASGNSNSVNQQSGLFAGDGGYHVKADSVDLKGGAIVSTATQDKNDLTTNRLTFSNIENQSQYDATTVSLYLEVPVLVVANLLQEILKHQHQPIMIIGVIALHLAQAYHNMSLTKIAVPLMPH